MSSEKIFDEPICLVKKIVLDVLKPHEPSIIDFATNLATLEGVDHVNVTSDEIDQDTESIKIVVMGNDIDLEIVRRDVENLGGVIHSLDEVTVAKKKL